ncbi:MAG: sigma-54 dependent transcriptional regulator [Desulfurivibrionaceae bacterium]|nr:sigma-54 dependent transcriptional regulator [Desulfobulbales bacterium]MDT8334231.1 sigma-54 dependent transcriptional regulator [Desulfurivibrionaceae bacterium]
MSEQQITGRLLIIDDEQNMRHMLKIMTEGAGYSAVTAEDGLKALALLKENEFDFILCDVKMPNMNGMDFLQASAACRGDAPVIMMSAYGTIDLALEAMKGGAYDFISKPFKVDEVVMALRKARERENLRRENQHLRNRLRHLEGGSRFAGMIGKSEPMRAVFGLAEKVARYSTTVLITGESGTGKELVARGIHFASPRRARPLVPVNCGGIPATLLESELFGHLKGAFTGADRSHKGLFEEAAGGTIFLDEVGELPLALQVKILRVLQEGEIRPVGSTETRKVDVRIIAATARNLEEEISRGLFREDLFYRLNVMPIHLPALREHPEDIPLLCRYFIERFNEQLGMSVKGISAGAMAKLIELPWPGNVRELENIIERAMVLSEAEILGPEVLPDYPDNPDDCLVRLAGQSGFSLKKAKKIWERKLITGALLATGGNRSRAAEMLELSFPSLLGKIKAYGIKIKKGEAS